jgi:hypothetical protein
MTTRRQALPSCESSALSNFFPLIPVFFFASDGTIARVTVILLMMLSAMTLILRGYHRRDYASPRRIGRRI